THRQTPTLFPYTTLFRSETVTIGFWPTGHVTNGASEAQRLAHAVQNAVPYYSFRQSILARHSRPPLHHPIGDPVCLNAAPKGLRSEEHTSELQSLRHLVC